MTLDMVHSELVRSCAHASHLGFLHSGFVSEGDVCEGNADARLRMAKSKRGAV